ncbi:MAG: hypothetical protein R6T89_06700 [Candidatus Syntrophosphaera sp.]
MRKTSFLVLSLLMALFLASCQINVAEPPFKARFHNMLYTDIHIWVDGYGFRVIPPNETVTFSINRSDQCYHYEAETHGTDAYGEQIGLVVQWERTRDISGDSYTTYLITYPDLFFLKMRNTGYHDLHPLYVNYGMIDETIDDIIIPSNNVLYRTGYYNAHGSTRIQADWLDMPTDYTYWQHGEHFYFPWTENQAITLINDFKKDADPQRKYETESNLVDHRSDEPFGIDPGVPREGSEPGI